MLIYAVNPWSYGFEKQLEKIVQSVIATLGGTVIDVPWGEALTDDEVQEILHTYGVCDGEKAMQDS
jgi:hypothetical protein